ncbi:MAG: glutamine synthetase, partial [Gammaproteobacteria bacterium]|nr:glutamine synthetase [Gammaproteobacteria bacterium]
LCAGLLKSFDDGIARKLDPGKPELRNIYDAMEAGKVVTKLPMSLGEALEALKKDDVVMQALPGEMTRVYMHYKEDEWAKFMATVTQWDIDTYIDVLP